MKNLVIVIPAHNEEAIIENTINKVISFMKTQKMIGVSWQVVVAENGSIDKTLEILQNFPKSKYFSFLSLKARSRDQAVKKAWEKIDSDYYMFMDADLATDIKHIPELIKWLEEGDDIVIGSRKLPDSEVSRPLSRRAISFAFHTLMKLMFNLKVKDLQCGFKSINKKVRDEIIPKTKYSEEGFLDTEMLVLASKKNYKIKEIPVKWDDSRDSKFKIGRTILAVFKSSFKIKRDLILGKYG